MRDPGLESPKSSLLRARGARGELQQGTVDGFGAKGAGWGAGPPPLPSLLNSKGQPHTCIGGFSQLFSSSFVFYYICIRHFLV